MDRVAYDRDARERRAVWRIAFWFVVTIIGLYAFSYVYRLLIGPFASFVYDRYTTYDESTAFIKTDTCMNEKTIAKVGSYRVACESARRVVAQGIYGGAMHDLMNHLSLCQRGVCTVFGYNVSNILFVIVVSVGTMALIAWCCGIAQFTSSYHARQVAALQLPMTAGASAPPGTSYVMFDPNFGAATLKNGGAHRAIGATHSTPYDEIAMHAKHE